MGTFGLVLETLYRVLSVMFKTNCLELLSVYFDKWGMSPAGGSGSGISIRSFIGFFKYFSSPFTLLLKMLAVFFAICLIYIQIEGFVKRKKRKKKFGKRKRKK